VKPSAFLCGSCFYFGWLKLERICRNPDAPRSLQKSAPTKCANYENEEKKALPGRPPHWKPMLTNSEFLAATAGDVKG